MADFVQTMKDWRRMCNTMRVCEECPMNEVKCWAESPSDLIDDFKKREDVIAEWAQNNPEPTFPTWDEWLTEQGVLQSPMPVPNMAVVAYYGGIRAHDPIPADIAQKLGIEPKC